MVILNISNIKVKEVGLNFLSAREKMEKLLLQMIFLILLKQLANLLLMEKNIKVKL